MRCCKAQKRYHYLTHHNLVIAFRCLITAMVLPCDASYVPIAILSKHCQMLPRFSDWHIMLHQYPVPGHPEHACSLTDTCRMLELGSGEWYTLSGLICPDILFNFLQQDGSSICRIGRSLAVFILNCMIQLSRSVTLPERLLCLELKG